MEMERDIRSIIVDKLMLTLIKRGVDPEIVREVKLQFEVELSKYEVQDRCTEVATVDTSAFQYLNQYLDTKRIEGKSENTINRYQYEISRLLWYYHKPLHEFTTDDIRMYLDYRKRNPVHKEAITNQTLDSIRKCYSAFFRWLAAERIIKWNPCLAVHKIKYKKTVRKSFTAVEMQKIREACNNPKELALIDWLSSTGCRVAEIASARTDLIDWNEKSIIVTGKGDKERKVYFNDVTCMHLQEYLMGRKDQTVALFAGRGGRPMSTVSIQQTLKRIGERAGVANVHCHRFRHTFATYMSSKMPITEVAALMGHDDISTTQIYVHSDPTKVMANYRSAMSST
jgi:site-specific recombinase XerD